MSSSKSLCKARKCFTSNLPTFEELIVEGCKVFRETFGSNPQISCYAPGRVNLMGEHIDYNDGYGLPIALPMVTITLGSRNNTKKTVDILTLCQNIDSPNRIQFETSDLSPGKPHWADYVKGVIHHFGQEVPGYNAVIVTNVPAGSGLSSSAALEVSTLVFLEELTGIRISSELQRATICMNAEHTHGGAPCGIMDQIASQCSTRGHALLIDFQIMAWYQIPCASKNLVFLICNSKISHALSDGSFALNRAHCERALEIIGKSSYRDVKLGDLKVLQDANEDILYRRVKHIITETKRTYDCAEALKKQNFKKLGKLMTTSHLSYRDDFETSCEEMDFLVDTANDCRGVLGSRMTGGGFGGCTVTLVRAGCVNSVIHRMKKEFKKKFQIEAEFYVTIASDGARAFNIMTSGL